MGKKTLYHPISLNVIRGAMEYCGVNPGRITQIAVNESVGEAWYTFDIERLPASWLGLDTKTLHARLDACFASDVSVIGVKIRYSACNQVEHISCGLHCRAARAADTEAYDDPGDGGLDPRTQEDEAIE